MKKALFINFILIGGLLIARDIDLNNFKMSSYTLKTYNKQNKLINEASFNSKHESYLINRYYYNEDLTLDKIEYYNMADGEPETTIYIYEEDLLTSLTMYNRKGGVKNYVNYTYENGHEVEKRYLDKKNKTKSVQKFYYQDNLKIKTEYLNSFNKIIQINLYKYEEDILTNVTVTDGNKEIKYLNYSYDDNNRLKFLYITNLEDKVTKLYAYNYDEQGNQIQYTYYIPK